MRSVLVFVGMTLLSAMICIQVAMASRKENQRDPLASPTPAPTGATNRRLLAFGEENPDCQLWTNWQRMCSRTGPDGEPACVTDPGRPVRPSEPFCVAPAAAVGPATPAQIASYRRFCRFRSARGSAQFSSCEGANDRPFNGRRVAARLHPWCRLWADEDSNLVCQTGGMNVANVPQCDALARRDHQARSTLRCVSRSMPNWCRTPTLLGDGPQYPFNGEFIALGYRIGNPTVVGAYCGRR